MRNAFSHARPHAPRIEADGHTAACLFFIAVIISQNDPWHVFYRVVASSGCAGFDFL
jgi:hypothetical protein